MQMKLIQSCAPGARPKPTPTKPPPAGSHDIAQQTGLAERAALIGSIQPQVLILNFLP
jgi:hypothetical protein